MKKSFYIIGTIFIFLLGSLFHFTYNHTLLTSIFSATDESTFQHMKLIIYPALLYFYGYYLLHKDALKKEEYFSSFFVFLITSTSCIPLLFYTMVHGLGIHNVWLDILLFLVSIILGFIHMKYPKIKLPYPILIPSFYLLYFIFTLKPLSIPLMQNP